MTDAQIIQKGFEAEARAFLLDCVKNGKLLMDVTDFTAEFDQPDFRLRFLQVAPAHRDAFVELLPPTGIAWMDVKAKNQRYTEEHWPSMARVGILEENAFLIDEEFLSLLQAKDRHIYVLVRDVPGNRLVLFNRRIFDTMPRIKINRPTKFNGVWGLKGKLLMNLRWGVTLVSPVIMHELLDQMLNLAYHVNGVAGEIPGYVRSERCYPYEGEIVPEEGIDRTDAHRQKDVAEK